jgi:hypothetical protein
MLQRCCTIFGILRPLSDIACDEVLVELRCLFKGLEGK